ncbi:AraC-like DNA-binding protein [Mumia flava]|uniref:AraC-like DNA-binding protein n=1 Tax=Mumia flava TaxID=1348852 RepID=A0A0B2B7D1_9ACTN|nr:AraC family transcriptional regulator [Mumia flava]PJJ57714.1 AraC-like DNA-binding protein [Mumia flava]
MDVLSDVLLSVRLTGAVFFDVDARSPFVTQSPSVASLHREVLPGAEHVIAFHVVTEGTCWAEIVAPGEAPVALKAGDMVAFPGGDANVMASAPGMRGAPDPSLYQRPPDRTLPFPLRMSRRSTADRTRFVCGFLGCDSRPFNPLLDSLPRIVHSPVSSQSRQWVAGLIDAAVQTSDREAGAGREALLAKLAELMFVEALRSHLAQLGEDERGWLAGVRQPQVGEALRLIHGRPADPWTLERLAHEVGMSRSSFADQFTTYVRIPPMRYLSRWRLQIAARLLKSGTVTVAQAATAVGYQSEASFNRAFKREVGSAPGEWRRRRPYVDDERS